MSLKPLELYPAAQLKSLPPVDWLIEGVIPKGALVTLFGASGLGKSFVALDMCLSVAAGRPWLDRFGVQQGQAIYLPFEGLAGLGQRLTAWETHYGIKDTPAAFWYARDFESIQSAEPMNRLIRGIELALPEAPKLVVIDTLSRAMMGAEENSAKDANIAMAHLDRLRAVTGTAIILIHHTTKNTDYERGSTAIRAACDTMLLLRRDDEALILKVDKQRDADPGHPIRLYMTPVKESVVLTQMHTHNPGELTFELAQITEIYESIREKDEPVSYSSWRDQCEAAGINPTTFKRRLATLVQDGQFVKVGTAARPKYIPAGEP